MHIASCTISTLIIFFQVRCSVWIHYQWFVTQYNYDVLNYNTKPLWIKILSCMGRNNAFFEVSPQKVALCFYWWWMVLLSTKLNIKISVFIVTSVFSSILTIVSTNLQHENKQMDTETFDLPEINGVDTVVYCSFLLQQVTFHHYK